MTGCISTKSRQMDINKSRLNNKNGIHKDKEKNTIARY